MPGPLFPVLGPVGLALVIFVALRRWHVASGIVGAGGAVLLGLVTAGIPLEAGAPAALDALIAGNRFSMLGHSLLLGEGVRQVLVIAFFAAALLFLLSALWTQGPDFVPSGLLALASLSFAIIVRPFMFGAVALLVAAGPLATMIQGCRAGSTLASLRFLAFTALTIPPFLISGWMLDSGQFGLVPLIWTLLLVAVIMLLAGFPFHLWVRPLVKESKPLIIVFVLGLVQLLLVTFIWNVIQEFPDLLQSTRLTTLLASSGAVTAILAGLLAVGANEPRRLLAAVVLADIGAALIVLSVGWIAMAQVWSLFLSRIMSLLLATAGLSLLQSGPAGNSGAARGALRRHFHGVALFVYGTASLLGLPLTPGFPARWAAAQLVAQHSLSLSLLLLLVAAAGSVGLLRLLAHVSGEGGPVPEELRLPDLRLSRSLLAIALVAGVPLALSSWPLMALAERLAEHF